MRYQEGKRRKMHAPREAVGAGYPARTSQKARKRLAKRGCKVNGFTLQPPFSSLRAGPAGPEGGPGRPSSPGAVPLKTSQTLGKSLCFAAGAGGAHEGALAGMEPTGDPAGWPLKQGNNKNQEI